jgi:anti-sigma regulatory factor (Ser/Thr protein kinase)
LYLGKESYTYPKQRAAPGLDPGLGVSQQLAAQPERQGGGAFLEERFASNEDAPRAARGFVREFIDGIDDTSAANLYVAISELVTNAVVHGGGDHVMVRLSQTDDQIRMEVSDEGTSEFDWEPPRFSRGDRAHGLEIVDAFTDRHGVEHTPQTCTWCELDLPAD